MGSSKIDGKWYAQIGGATKQYLVNAVPTTDGPHNIVISDRGAAKSVSKIDDIRFHETVPELVIPELNKFV